MAVDVRWSRRDRSAKRSRVHPGRCLSGWLGPPETIFEQPALRGIRGERQRAAVGVTGVRAAAEGPQELRACRVEEVVRRELVRQPVELCDATSAPATCRSAIARFSRTTGVSPRRRSSP